MHSTIENVEIYKSLATAILPDIHFDRYYAKVKEKLAAAKPVDHSGDRTGLIRRRRLARKHTNDEGRYPLPNNALVKVPKPPAEELRTDLSSAAHDVSGGGGLLRWLDIDEEAQDTPQHYPDRTPLPKEYEVQDSALKWSTDASNKKSDQHRTKNKYVKVGSFNIEGVVPPHKKGRHKIATGVQWKVTRSHRIC